MIPFKKRYFSTFVEKNTSALFLIKAFLSSDLSMTYTHHSTNESLNLIGY